MTQRLPDIPSSGGGEISAFNAKKAARDLQKGELEVFRYQLGAAIDREKAITDVQMIRDVLSVATDEELDFLNEFAAKANGSATAREIVSRKLEMFDSIVNRKITRRMR
jgi:hypothetical protein